MRDAIGVKTMLIERTKEKKPDSMMTQIGSLIEIFANGLKLLAEEMQYKFVDKEVKP